MGNSNNKFLRSLILPVVVFLCGATFSYNSANLRKNFAMDGLLRQLQEGASVMVLSNSSSSSSASAGSGDDQPLDAHHKVKSRHESLVQLTRPFEQVTCPNDLKPVPMVSNPQADDNSNTQLLVQQRQIPPIIHMTGKTKCITPPFLKAAQKWASFPDWSFYFHDDAAVEDLILHRDWPEFPQLSNTLTCLRHAGGAAKADLWRYLALYEYGGIYTDMDNFPNYRLLNGTAIMPHMQAFFLQEQEGFMSQYFFAMAPRHPLMFLAIQDLMREVHFIEDIGTFYVPVVTGPGVIKRAFLQFMGINQSNKDSSQAASYNKPKAGVYRGQLPQFVNHTVHVVGSRLTNNEWVIRTAVYGPTKMQGWRAMNISNYQAMNKEPVGKSCIMVLQEEYSRHKR